MKDMKNNKNKWLLFTLTAALLLGGCAGGARNSADESADGSSSDGVSDNSHSSSDGYQRYEYDAVHESENNILTFKSSDDGLDHFLNDFFERHSRYSENRIHTHPVGAGGTAWKEWETLIGSWWDASSSFNSTIPAGYATKDLVQSWLLSPQQDNQGYVWSDEGNTPGAWGMGWAFPYYTQTPSVTCGFEFDDGIAGWSSPSGATLGLTDTIYTGDGSKELTAAAENVSEISVESPGINATTFYAPFMALGMSFNNTGDAANLDDIYVSFQTKNDGAYSDDKTVKFSDFCTTGLPVTGNVPADGYYLPMYINEKWGQSESNVVTKIKISVKAKEGTKIGGKLRFDFIRCDYDDRQANNVGIYVTAAAELLAYAQDASLTKHILPKVRAAMQHYLTCLDGADGLMSTEYYVGHDGQGTVIAGTGIGDGYWDVTSYPDVNLYTNIQYYRAIEGMIYLEKLADSLGVKAERPTIKGKDMKTTATYAETAESLEALRKKVKSQFESYFWNEKKGRFLAGYYGGVKSEDNIQDNGYLHFNLEAVAAGLGTDEQQASIMSWINGDRTIAGDNAQGEDIYAFEFAPRNTTKQNYGDYSFVYNGCNWGTGVHNGGAVMQTSYYDLIARTKIFGADNAYARLKDIQKWYDKVASYRGVGWDFYRAYYDTTNIGMQGGPTGGAVGLDYEFLEAALMYAAVPTAFFGIRPSYEKSLVIAPSMPSGLDYWKMENLTFGGRYYDVSIGKYFVQVSGVRDKTGKAAPWAGYTLEVRLNKPSFPFDVYVNGFKTNYEEIGERISVSVPFNNSKVEIIGR